jgi:hypothetical protein
MVANAEEIKNIVNEQLKDACLSGGIIYTMIHDKPGKPPDRKDGIAGMLNANGNKMQPDKFESEAKSGTLFRHWNEEVKSYIKIMDTDIMVLLNIAEKDPDKKMTKETIKEYIEEQSNMDNKDKNFMKYAAKMQDIGDMYENIKDEKDEQLHTLLMFMLGGEAKEMARNASPSGMEAWRSLNYRWNRKTQFGATQIAEMIAKISPAKNVDEVYAKLNQLERLHLELQKNLGEDIVNGQSVKVHYGEAFKKADVLKVVNEEFNTQLKKDGKELEKMSYQELVDKVQSYVRLNSKGKSNMDMGMINMNTDIVKDATIQEGEEGNGEKEEEEEWPNEHWIGYVGYPGQDKGKGKGKGKGGGYYGGKGGKSYSKGQDSGKGYGKKGDSKGQAWTYRFEGTCNGCGKYGHRVADCRSKGDSQKGNGKGSGFGKGPNMNSFANYNDMYAARPQSVGGQKGYQEPYGYPTLMQVEDGHCHVMFHLEHKDEQASKNVLGDWIEVAMKSPIKKRRRSKR